MHWAMVATDTREVVNVCLWDGDTRTWQPPTRPGLTGHWFKDGLGRWRSIEMVKAHACIEATRAEQEAILVLAADARAGSENFESLRAQMRLTDSEIGRLKSLNLGYLPDLGYRVVADGGSRRLLKIVQIGHVGDIWDGDRFVKP